MFSKLNNIGIKWKLIFIFLVIKIIPLALLAWIAQKPIISMGNYLDEQIKESGAEAIATINEMKTIASERSINALDLRSREAIEYLSTNIAKNLANFLYSCDGDILAVTGLPADKKAYQHFINSKKRDVIYHNPWKLNAEGTSWIPEKEYIPGPTVTVIAEDNQKDFHSRPPEEPGIRVNQPLYLEMTFVSPDGQELVKAVNSKRMSHDLKDISKKENTYVKAETYFEHLKYLKEGEIYVSDVIGPYIGSDIIGPYTPKRAEALGVPFEPEKHAYSGKENPVGKRFQGIVRWVTPVFENGTLKGYVTLALDHTHIMEFTDHIMPTEERYTVVSDPASGNYAWMWDYKGRCISHPRDHSIFGYDPKTGEPAVPWLSSEIYDMWQKSGLPISEFLETGPKLLEQSWDKKAAAVLTKAGLVGLDCRYLNFAPQCTDWTNLTQHGGSGSFVILWTGLYKLTVAAAIPYHTGIYSDPRGFGYVTVGANVDEFHSSATEMAENLKVIAADYEANSFTKIKEVERIVGDQVAHAINELIIYAVIMTAVVVFVAILVASFLTSRLTSIIDGMRKFKDNDISLRLDVRSGDELGQLAYAFNDMADGIAVAIDDLKRTENQYRNIFENASEGIFQAQRDNFIAINNAMVRLLGCENQQEFLNIYDSPYKMFVDKEKFSELFDLADEKEEVRFFEAEILKNDDTKIFSAISMHMVKNEKGTLLFYEGIIQDVTIRQKALEALEGAKQAAEAASSAKSNFLSNMSHEIRTPINIIIGMTHLVLESDLSDQQKGYINKISAASHSLMNVVSDILDFSKIDTGQVELNEISFDLRALFKEIYTPVGIKASEKNLELIVDFDNNIPVKVEGDSVRLIQLLSYLTDNAIKFTEKGEIFIGCKIVSKKHKNITLEFIVKDTGIGMSEEQQKRLGEPFLQGDATSTTRKYGGTGLGITIVSNLVKLMNGSMSVESELGKGSSFKIIIPFKTETSDEIFQVLNAAEQLCSMKVMLVEDNDTARFYIANMLKSFGFKVDSFASGSEALVALYQQGGEDLYKLIIIDLLMTGMNGIQLAMQIHKEHMSDAPMILLASAGSQIGNSDEIMSNAGISCLIYKPVDPLSLFNEIMTIFGESTIKSCEDSSLKLMLGKEIPGDATKGSITDKAAESAKTGTNIAETDILPASLPGIDMEEGLSRTSGNKSLFRKLLVKYLNNYENAPEQVEKLLQENKRNDARILVHSIKGVSGNLGIKTMQNAAAELEGILKDEGNDAGGEAFEKAFETFSKELALVISTLKNNFSAVSDKQSAGTAGAAEKPEGSLTELRGLLDELLEPLSKRRPKPCKDIVEKMHERNWPIAYIQLLNDLYSAVSKYRFDLGIEIHTDLIKKIDGDTGG